MVLFTPGEQSLSFRLKLLNVRIPLVSDHK